MSSPVSVFQGLAQDATLKTTLGQLRHPRGKLLFHDTFDTGFCGWRDHIASTNQPSAPLGLSTHPTGPGRYALELTTSATTSAGQDGTCTGYKNMTRPVDTGLVVFSAMLAYRGAADQAAPRSIFMGMDCQAWDDSSRGFAKLTLQRWVGTAPDAFTPKWSLTDDSGNFVDVPASAAVSPSKRVLPAVPGWNENKANWFWVTLAYDLGTIPAGSADGLPGGYAWAQIGNNTYDLTGLGAGRGAQTPQTVNFGGTSFAGGLNFGLGLTNRTATADGPASLICGEAFAYYTGTAS